METDAAGQTLGVPRVIVLMPDQFGTRQGQARSSEGHFYVRADSW